MGPHVVYGTIILVSDTASLMTFLGCGQRLGEVMTHMKQRVIETGQLDVKSSENMLRWAIMY